MSQQRDDHEELLRRALHSAVESVEPADDGLERIRARLTTPYPLPVAWVMAAYSEVTLRARGWLQSISVWLQTVLGPRLELRRWVMAAYSEGTLWAGGWLQSISVWLQRVLGPRLDLRRLARSGTPDGRRRLAQVGLAAAMIAATVALA